MVKVLLLPEKKELEVDANNVGELLEKLNIYFGEVIVIDRKERKILDLDDLLNSGADIEIRKVISGG